LTISILDRLEIPSCYLQFSISQLALKAGSSVAGAVEGSDNKDLEVLRQILRQIYSEAGLVEY